MSAPRGRGGQANAVNCVQGEGGCRAGEFERIFSPPWVKLKSIFEDKKSSFTKSVKSYQGSFSSNLKSTINQSLSPSTKNLSSI